VEARLTVVAGLLLCGLAAVAVLFPRALAYPVAALAIWGGLVLLFRGIRLCREPRRCLRPDEAASPTPGVDGGATNPRASG
jgi:small neutral amino acid transporter SnatA (MarC family)